MRAVLFVFFFISNLVGSAQYHFTLEGKTPDILNNKKIYLTIWDRYSDHKYMIRDSVTIKNNMFMFEGFITKPSEQAELLTKQVKGYLIMVVDSGMNKLIVQPTISKTPLYPNKLSKPLFVNSRSNMICRQIDSLGNLYYLTKAKPAATNKNILQLSSADHAELRKRELAILKQNPDVYYSLIHLYTLSRYMTATEIYGVFNSLNSEIKKTVLGIEFEEMLQQKRNSETGSIVKEFNAKTNSDESFSSSSLNGKAYLLAFGATWCQPCKEKLPFLRKQYEKFQMQGLEIVYVNLDTSIAKWKKQIVKDKMNWINISENVEWKQSKISKQFSVTALPFYLVVDKSGKIIYNEREMNDPDLKLLENYLKQAVL